MLYCSLDPLWYMFRIFQLINIQNVTREIVISILISLIFLLKFVSTRVTVFSTSKRKSLLQILQIFPKRDTYKINVFGQTLPYCLYFY